MNTGTYYRRREMGLCTECGEPLPDGWKHRRCGRCMNVKHTSPRPIEREQANTQTNKSLDAMAKEAHHRGISYGRLQSEETIDRIRYAEKTNMTLKRWGRQVMFG